VTANSLTSSLSHLDLEAIGEAVRAETRNRECRLPPISIYRWWARRTEAVNGALLDAVGREQSGRLVIADPFAGGGVIPLSALTRGHAVYAQDLNPWVVEGLAAMLSLPHAQVMAEAGVRLCAAAARLVEKAYGTRFADGAPAQISQSIRVVRSSCPACGHVHRLFPHALVSLKKRKERRQDEAFLACPHGHLFDGLASIRQSCPTCAAAVDPAAVYHPSRIVTCPACSSQHSLRDRSSRPWQWDLVLVERSDGKRREFSVPSAEEVAAADEDRWLPKRRLGAIPDAPETRVLIRHGFSSWSDLYPARQRYVMEQLLAAVQELSVDERTARALTMAVLGTAEMAGHMSRWDRYYLKSYESMASHRFNLTTLSVEPNVVGAGMSGRGTLRRRLRLFERAAAWFDERKIDRSLAGWYTSAAEHLVDPAAAVNIVSGSSERLLLPDQSVDVVLTDPPYHDDVQYHELSLPFRAWAKLTRTRIPGEAVAIPHSALLSGHKAYRGVLQKVFRELRRVLKPDGRLLFSYANREPAAWVNLFAALKTSGFQPLGYSIVRSENESDHAKRGGRACNLDLILELAPDTATISDVWRPTPYLGNDEENYLIAVGEAFLRTAVLVNGWETELVDELRSHAFVREAKRQTLLAIDENAQVDGSATVSAIAHAPGSSLPGKRVFNRPHARS
jgi:adenine-specific DNA methylase